MGKECDYSFGDLFNIDNIVNGRYYNDIEKKNIMSNQTNRNSWIKSVAAKSKGLVATQDRLGTDGLIYTAFWLTHPLWFHQIVWQGYTSIAELSLDKVPRRSGCYLFSEPSGNALYVGEAIDLPNRLAQYIGNKSQDSGESFWSRLFSRQESKHSATRLIRNHLKEKGPENLYIRWTLYAGQKDLEASLIDYLNPPYNSKAEGRIMAELEPLSSEYLGDS